MYIKLSRAAQDCYYMLTALGGTVYVGGGAVRDTVLGIQPKDFDLVVTGLSENILAKLPDFHYAGEHFGVFYYKRLDSEVQVALPRREVSTGPGHLDFEVECHKDILITDDLERRDFTINAMAVRLHDSSLIDLYYGEDDARRGIVRAITDKAFVEDPLRVLRAYVPVARYGFNTCPATRQLLMAAAPTIVELPNERIQMELDKIFEGIDVAKAIKFMVDDGVLDYIFPELMADWNYNQNNKHHQQLLGPHQLSTLKWVASATSGDPDPDLRLAALLHDIGKPQSAWVDPVTGSNHFYCKKVDDPSWPWPLGYFLGHDHELVGATMAIERLRELKYPEKRIQRIGSLIAGHMWAPFTTERGARRFMNKYGELADDLITLRYGDQNGKYESPTNPEHNLILQRGLLETVREKGEATHMADLAISGRDLIEAGFEPGPMMGEILRYLTDKVLDEPSLNTKEMLLTIAEDTYADC